MIKIKIKDSNLFIIINNYVFFLNDISNSKVEVITSNNFNIKFNYIEYNFDSDCHNFVINSIIDLIIIQVPHIFVQSKQNLT